MSYILEDFEGNKYCGTSIIYKLVDERDTIHYYKIVTKEYKTFIKDNIEIKYLDLEIKPITSEEIRKNKLIVIHS